MKVLALILAGGEGTRLSILTEKRAKPAVPFAGKYRIIDFTLSNCVNSGIYSVGILTQYRPRSLNDHIRRGRPWDLDRSLEGGVTMLQPYRGRRDEDWYKGTADAVYQNLDFVLRQKSDYVLILAGDHVYKMNYEYMITFHEEKRADLTVAAINVSPEEAHRFGILTVDDDWWVLDFQEKPAEPKSTLASMGIYVFNTNVLAERLEEDARRRTSHDFGRDIIPRMVAEGASVYAYPFSGYWVDVGTIEAYWRANMDLLAEEPPFDLHDRSWVIHTRSEERPPVKVRRGGRVARSLVSNGCIIEGRVNHSVLSPGVRVERGAVVRDSVVMTDALIKAGAVVDHAILDKNVVVGEGACIGFGDDYTPNETQPNLTIGLTVVGKNTRLPAGIRVGRNCLISSDIEDESFFATDFIPSGKTIGQG